jgi:uncharacterized repeat protein (TIGR01451 family)
MSFRGTLRSLHKKISKKTAIVAAVVVLGIAGGAVAGIKTVAAERADCDGNAVMHCGAYDLGTLKSKYASNASTRAIYAASPFKISSNAFYGATNSNGFVNGYVNRNNTITVNGRVVATNAITAGRSYIAGSTRMNIPGVEAYTRPPSVSFKQASLQAYIKLDANGKFEFAIIKACGNPATGTPTTPPAKPSFTIEKKVRVAGSGAEFKEDVAVSPSQKVEYVVGVTNTGNVTLNDMRVRDTLPAGVTYVNNSTYMITSYSGRHVIPNGITTPQGVNIGDMPAGGTAFVFFQATAPAVTNPSIKICDTGRTTLLNRAFAKPVELPEQNNTANINLCRPTKPNFTIEKKVKIANTSDEFSENVVADPGTELTFVIGVQNTGNTVLKNILVKDVLPAGFTYVPGKATIVTSDGTPTTKISDNLVTTGYTIPSLKTGAVAFIFFNAKLPTAENPIVPDCEVGKVKLRNVANAKPEGLTVKEDDATAETCKEIEKTPNFEIQKDVRKKGETVWKQDVTVEYGDTVEYRILVKNTGETNLTNVLVKDARPTGVDYVAGTLKVNGTASTADLFGAGVTIPEIKLGATAEVTFDAKLQGQPQPCVTKKFKNIASAKPVGLEEKKDDANVDANCKQTNPKVDIEKKVSKQVIPVTGEFVYTLEVTNTGDVALNNVKVTDPAPEGVNFLESTRPEGTTTTVGLTNFEATIAKLNVGQKVTFQIKSKVIKEVVGKIINTACVDAPEIPGDKDDCDSIEIETPAATCTALAALSLGEFKYRFTPQISKTPTVTVTNVNYNFGDGSALVNKTDASPTEHQFTQTEEEASYTVTAAVTFNLEGVSKTVNCVAQVTVSPKVDEPCPYNPNLPKDDVNCVPPCPYNPELPQNSTECKPPVTDVCPETPGVQTSTEECPTPPVTVIPSTGAGSVAASLVGISTVAYGAVALMQRRKSLK